MINRIDNYGSRLANIEIRAGVNELENQSSSEKINKNYVCGSFCGPGEEGKIYSITCKTPIIAKYVTLQIIPNVTFPNPLPESILQINEITLHSVFSSEVVT